VHTSFPGADTDDESLTEDLAGLRIGNSYSLTEPIGGGATGTVWRAIESATGEEVAIKLLREDLMRQPKAVTRFVQERAILLMLRHAHIVRVRDLLTVGDSLGLVMDLVEGGNLREYLRARGTLTTSHAAGLMAQVAQALAEAHRHEVVHRDLKPDNILMDRVDDERVEVRLTDFGIARVLNTPGMTTPGALVGTPSYLAPETVYGAKPTPAVDVYALGIMLFELVAGRPPYSSGPPWAVMRKHVDESPERVDGMPDALWRVIVACTDKRPAQRPSAAALVTTLTSLARSTARVAALIPLPDEPVAPPTSVAVPRPRVETSHVGARGWSLLMLASVLATVLLAMPAWQMFGRHLADEQHAKSAGPTSAPSSRALPVLSPPTVHSGAPAPAGGSAPSAGPAPAGVAAGVPAASAVVTSGSPKAGPSDRAVEVGAYGPWQCASGYSWDFGHPVLAQPCHALGSGIKLIGHLQAIPGVQADVTMTLLNVDDGSTVAGPHECTGLTFTSFTPQHECGPFDAQPPHGHTYVVVEAWRYTGRGVLPSGSVRGTEFTW
jgi:serine/threonine-protein kinase